MEEALAFIAPIVPVVPVVLGASVTPSFVAHDEVPDTLSPSITEEPQAEVPVAALVVAPDGRILSRARNRPITDHDPSAHAEVLALREAACITGNYRLTNCVLVVTLEPCLMCVGALVHARVAGVVYGAADVRAGAVDSCIAGLNLPFLNHHPWHLGGVRGEVCAQALRQFFVNFRARAAF